MFHIRSFCLTVVIVLVSKIVLGQDIFSIHKNADNAIQIGDTSAAMEIIDIYVVQCSEQYNWNSPQVISALYMAGQFYFDNDNLGEALAYFNKAFGAFSNYESEQVTPIPFSAVGSKSHALLLLSTGKFYLAELSNDLALDVFISSGDTFENNLYKESLEIKGLFSAYRFKPEYVEDKVMLQEINKLATSVNLIKQKVNFYSIDFNAQVDKADLNNLRELCQSIKKLINPEGIIITPFDFYYSVYSRAMIDLGRISAFENNFKKSFDYYVKEIPLLSAVSAYKYSDYFVQTLIEFSKILHQNKQTPSAIHYAQKALEICVITNEQKLNYPYILTYLELYSKAIGALENSRYYYQLNMDLKTKKSQYSTVEGLDKTDRFNDLYLIGLGYYNIGLTESAIKLFNQANDIYGDSIIYHEKFLPLLFYRMRCYHLLDDMKNFYAVKRSFDVEFKRIQTKIKISHYELQAYVFYVCDYWLENKLNHQDSIVYFTVNRPYILNLFNSFEDGKVAWIKDLFINENIKYCLKYCSSEDAIAFIKSIKKNDREGFNYFYSLSRNLKEIGLLNYFYFNGRNCQKLYDYVNHERSIILADINLHDQISAETIFKDVLSMNRALETLMFNGKKSQSLINLNFNNRIEMQQMLTRYSSNRAKFSKNQDIDSIYRLLDNLTLASIEAELRHDTIFEGLQSTRRVLEQKLNIELSKLELDTISTWKAIYYENSGKFMGQELDHLDKNNLTSSTALIFCVGPNGRNGYVSSFDTVIVSCYIVEGTSVKWNLLCKLPRDSVVGKKDVYTIRNALAQSIQNVDPLKPLYYVKDPYLNEYCFNTLTDKDGKYLIETYDLRLLSEFNNITTRLEFGKIKDVTLIGGVVYDTSSRPISDYQSTFGLLGALDQNYRSTSSVNWKYLPATKDEVYDIKNHFENKNLNVIMKIGLEPTEEYFATLSGNSPDVLHISTHGFFFKYNSNKDNELSFSKNSLVRCGLALAGANNINRNTKFTSDGILTGLEISTLDLQKTQLVVLSACETGLGDASAGDGIYGLQRAFKLAGVKYVMMSLWNVPDKETKEFMSLFYSKWNIDNDICAAFRQTQLTMLARYKDSPKKWAAFELLN